MVEAPATAPATTPPTRDRLFGPTLLVGVAGAALLAVAGHRDWVSLDTSAAQEGVVGIFVDANPGLAQEPLAGAMGLVALGAWGALLVTRGLWRRIAAGLTVLAGLTAVASWFSGLTSLADGVEERAVDYGLADALELGWTPWFAVALVAAVLTAAAGVVAVLRVGRWPAMGTRYDAPVASGAGAVAARTTVDDLADADPTELWKSLDEGHDPT